MGHSSKQTSSCTAQGTEQAAEWSFDQVEEGQSILSNLSTSRQMNRILTWWKQWDIDQQAAQYALPEIEKQNQQLCNAHKKCDELQAEIVKRQHRLESLEDQLEELKREAQLVKATQYDSPQAKVLFGFALTLSIQKLTIIFFRKFACLKIV